MKELTEKHDINPHDFCELVPKAANREHSKSLDPLSEILNDEKYHDRLKKELSEPQYKYVEGLIAKTSEKFKNVGLFRTAFYKNGDLFDDTTDLESDKFILGRVFGMN